ncbi:MAG: TetR family transcriptional regulator [Gaiellaceae bacterium]
MSSSLTHSPRHDRTAAAILDAAAHVLAADGAAASMADVASAAGVGRATLYRYFETRESLFEALAADAVADAQARLADAGLEGVTVELAIERIVRAIVAVGDRYAVLVREEILPDRDEAARVLGAPILAVFARGVETGALRSDISIEILLELFGGLLASTVKLVGERRIGLEDAAAAVTDMFLQGARAK